MFLYLINFVVVVVEIYLIILLSYFICILYQNNLFISLFLLISCFIHLIENIYDIYPGFIYIIVVIMIILLIMIILIMLFILNIFIISFLMT